MSQVPQQFQQVVPNYSQSFPSPQGEKGGSGIMIVLVLCFCCIMIIGVSVGLYYVFGKEEITDESCSSITDEVLCNDMLNCNWDSSALTCLLKPSTTTPAAAAAAAAAAATAAVPSTSTNERVLDIKREVLLTANTNLLEKQNELEKLQEDLLTLQESGTGSADQIAGLQTQIATLNTQKQEIATTITQTQLEISEIEDQVNEGQIKPNCLENYRVHNGECVACEKFPDGSQKTWSSAGANPNGSDTSCTKSSCPKDYHVNNGNCEKCLNGTIRSEGDDPNGSNTKCLQPLCSIKQKITCSVQPEKCEPSSVDCVTGYIAGDVTTPSTTCPNGCTLTNAVNTVPERCEYIPMDCETGYIPGDATTPSTTCPDGCTLTIAEGTTPESCEAPLVNCETGYIPGDATTPSTTCPTGCTLTHATNPIPESCEASPVDCETDYIPGDATTPSTTCPAGCTLTPGRSSVSGETFSPECDANGYCTSCSCTDCPDNFEAKTIHTLSPSDPQARETLCVPLGEGASRHTPCKPTQKVQNNQCVDCPGPASNPDSDQVQMYGGPCNSSTDVNNQPGPNCKHIEPPISSEDTTCKYAPCKQTEIIVNSEDGAGNFCQACGLDELDQQRTNSLLPEENVSPQNASLLLINGPKNVCSSDIISQLSTFCTMGGEVNDQWKYNEYHEWINKVYASRGNKDSWLPNHGELIQDILRGSDEGIATIRNLTNRDIYYPGLPEGHPITYSYMKDRKWVSLCDCSQAKSINDIVPTRNGRNAFTNCFCESYQYLELGERIDPDNLGTCRNIESKCYSLGNYFSGVRIEEGKFWNVKDPVCNFMHRDSGEIMGEIIGEEGRDISQYMGASTDRCCVGCNHKVYEGGIATHDSSKVYSNTKYPEYALNWWDVPSGPTNVQSQQGSKLMVNVAHDPIFSNSEEYTEVVEPYENSNETVVVEPFLMLAASAVAGWINSDDIDEKAERDAEIARLRAQLPPGEALPGTQQSAWRKYDVTTGFNSRPLYFYPTFKRSQLDSDNKPKYPVVGGGRLSEKTEYDWEKSQNALETGINHVDSSIPGGTESGCHLPEGCTNTYNKDILLSNIFTCKKTNPGYEPSESLDLPVFGITEDELYYGQVEMSSVPLMNTAISRNDGWLPTSIIHDNKLYEKSDPTPKTFDTVNYGRKVHHSLEEIESNSNLQVPDRDNESTYKYFCDNCLARTGGYKDEISTTDAIPDVRCISLPMGSRQDWNTNSGYTEPYDPSNSKGSLTKQCSNICDALNEDEPDNCTNFWIYKNEFDLIWFCFINY